MKFKTLSLLTPLSVLSAATTLACNNSFSLQKNQNIVYKINNNQSYFDIFTAEQLKIIAQYQPVFSRVNNVELSTKNSSYEDNILKVNTNSNNFSVNLKSQGYIPAAPISLELVNENGFEYIKQADKTNLASYDVLFNNIDYLFKTENVDWPSINSIFKRLISVELNDSYNILNPNFIPSSWIRAKAWIKNQEQISYWEDFILLELKRFDFGDLNPIHKVKITPVSYIDSVDESIYKNTPIIKIDFLDSQNRSLLSESIRDQEWIIGQNNEEFLLKNTEQNRNLYTSVFRNYNSKSDFNHTLDISDDTVLFNEYVNPYFGDVTILKYVNEFALNQNQYEVYVNPTYEFNHVTARSFAWFLKTAYKDFIIEVPSWRRDIDKEYRLKNISINNDYLNGTESLIELEIEVTKQSGDKKIYKWYSIDINAHYHTFARYKISPDLNWHDPNLYGWEPNIDKSQTIKPTQITDTNEFFELILPKLMSLQVYKLRNNLSLFNNRTMDKYEAHLVLTNHGFWNQFKTRLGLDVFKYLIGNSLEQNYWVEDISLQVVGLDKDPGTVLIKADLLDNNKNSLLNEQNRSKILKLSGFNGTDYSRINNQINKYNIEEIALDYLLQHNGLKLKDKNNVVDYVFWKD
ncbi:MAG3240 family lipoprotein [Mycoplasma simbae]|uniref:MAG3240 family lipoprotein n=1 Tax=Mycoplasma simbae TaxID=36744 RepID=UPI0004959B58|nr:hypothetical protein [Mycoplasma simbae]